MASTEVSIITEYVDEAKKFVFSTTLGRVLIGFVGVVITAKTIRRIVAAKRRAAWRERSKTVAILHQLPRALNAPNPSPFCLKVETYLRMANIPYEVDNIQPFGPLGKTPWMNIDEEEIADSQLIIEHLSQKYNKVLKDQYNAEAQGLARAVQTMLEERTFWGLVMERFFKSDLSKIMRISPCQAAFIQLAMRKKVKQAVKIQGIGRHTESTIEHFINDDLKALSDVLGSKKFLLGDEPCEPDCAIFGLLAQVIWCAPGSTYARKLQDDYPNLRDYCLRMKEKFWPDWEEHCSRNKVNPCKKIFHQN